jgi:hypothetical protein
MLLTGVGSVWGKKQSEFSDGPFVQLPTINIWNICRTAAYKSCCHWPASPPPPLMSVGLFIVAQLEMKPSITAVVFHQYTRWSYNWRSNNKSCSACGNCQSIFFLTWMFLFLYFVSKESHLCSCYVGTEKHVLGIGSPCDASQIGASLVLSSTSSNWSYCISESACLVGGHTQAEQSVFLNLWVVPNCEPVN